MIDTQENQPAKQNAEWECTTVVLRRNRIKPKAFRCMYCGKLLGAINDSAKLIFDGRIEEGDGYIETGCERCHVIFRILQ